MLGNYGSGKTELSLNFAIDAAKKKKTVLVDFDIVNPFFRSSEQVELLKQNNVELISQPYSLTNVDLPVVGAMVNKVFDQPYEYVVFDVGGDPVGATALGRFKSKLDKFPNKEVFLVVNTLRPLTQSFDDINEMLLKIQNASRQNITALINNTNIAKQTLAEHILKGQEILATVSKKNNIPIKYITGTKEILDKIDCDNISGELLSVVTYMKPQWL